MKNKVKVLIFIIILLIVALGSIGILYLNGKVNKTNIKQDDYLSTLEETQKEYEEKEIVDITSNQKEDYSWVLKEIGIQKEYEEIKNQINQSVEIEAIQGYEEVEKYKVKMSLKDIGYDNNLLIAGWTIESPQLMEMFTQQEGEKVEEIKKGIENTLELDLTININNDKFVCNYSLQDGIGEIINNYKITKCLSDNKILIYEIFILDNLELEDIRDIKINIYRILESFSDGAWEVANGNWEFVIKDIKKNTEFIKEYDLPAIVEYDINKEYIEEYDEYGNVQKKSNQMNILTSGEKGKLEINKLINCKTASLIYVTSNLDIETDADPTYFYCFDITDINGNVILDKTLLYYLEEEPIITQEKLKENGKYYINIYKIVDSDIYYIQPRISEVGDCEFIKSYSQEFKLGQ